MTQCARTTDPSKEPDGDNPPRKEIKYKKETWSEYLPRFIRYFFRGAVAARSVVIAIVSLGFLFVFVSSKTTISGCHEIDIRWFGMLLQLTGFVTVAYGLKSSEVTFNRPSMLKRLKGFLGGIPSRTTKNIIVNAKGTAFGSASVFARGTVLPGKGTSTREWLERLTENYENLHKEVGELSAELKTTDRNLTYRINEKASQLEKSVDDLKEQLEESVVGGIHVEWWGLVFFVAGIILASASQEIAAWLGHSRGCID